MQEGKRNQRTNIDISRMEGAKRKPRIACRRSGHDWMRNWFGDREYPVGTRYRVPLDFSSQTLIFSQFPSGVGLRFGCCPEGIGGKMGTAGLAGQPLINNQKGAHATTGVRTRRVRPPRPIETDHDPQGLCAVIWRDAVMHTGTSRLCPCRVECPCRRSHSGAQGITAPFPKPLSLAG